MKFKAFVTGLFSVGVLLWSGNEARAFPKYLDVNTLNGTNGFSINGKAAGHRLGRVVSKVGDINGDGFDDVIVATKSSFDVVVIFGKASGFPQEIEAGTLDGTNGFTIQLDSDELTVGGGGDVNGDGIDDVIIGSPKSNGNTGRAYVLFGRKNPPFPAVCNGNALNGVNGFVLDGAIGGSQFGFSVAIAKDINGDHLDDLVVGAPHDIGLDDPSDPSAFDGRAYIVLGKTNFPASLSAANLLGYGFSFAKSQYPPDDSPSPNDLINMELGWSVSGAGDVNRDGYNDLLIGAPRQNGFFQSDFGQAFTGMTYVLFGNPNLPNGPVQDIFIQGWTAQDEMGRCVSEAGDVNGDGVDDLLISSPLAVYDGNFGINGQACVLLGTQNLPEKNLVVDLYNANYPNWINGAIFDGGSDAEYCGRSVSRAGDMNGDGLDEIIIGSPKTNQGNGVLKGEAWVIFGRKEPYPNLGVFQDGYVPFLGSPSAWEDVPGFGFRIGTNEDMGWSVSDAGDVNGDGLEDVIIGAPESNTPSKIKGGRAYVIFGQLTNPGDIDGDGNVDLILQQGKAVKAALMKDGVYTGVTKTLVALSGLQEKVVAVNDFDLDGQTDLVTQNGLTVNLRKGPAYSIAGSFNLYSNMFNNIGPQIIASGNVMGNQVKGKLGYPDLIVRSAAMGIGSSSTNYQVCVNQGNGSFSAPQPFYTLVNGNSLVGCGRFLNVDKPLKLNQYADVIIQKLSSPGKDVYAKLVSNLNGVGQFLTFMPLSCVLGSSNFKQATKEYELIGTNNANGATIGIAPVFSGYTLSADEKIVGPK